MALLIDESTSNFSLWLDTVSLKFQLKYSYSVAKRGMLLLTHSSQNSWFSLLTLHRISVKTCIRSASSSSFALLYSQHALRSMPMRSLPKKVNPRSRRTRLTSRRMMWTNSLTSGRWETHFIWDNRNDQSNIRLPGEWWRCLARRWTTWFPLASSTRQTSTTSVRPSRYDGYESGEADENVEERPDADDVCHCLGQAHASRSRRDHEHLVEWS